MSGWLDLGLSLLSLPVLLCAGYLFLLALLARRRKPPTSSTPHRHFDLVVPAHNEELGIAATVNNLQALDYPATLFRILVVADNCSDQTAAAAAAAGARVLVRTNAELRGKGYALAHAFEVSAKEGLADAVVVVDADTRASPNLLQAFAARLDAGALAAQAHYGVLNPGASWRTRLMTIALALFHVLRSLGRERLGVSCGLRGNGMCFSAKLLREVPHEAFSLVEDLEYGIRLGRAGHRVHYAGEAEVKGEMVSGEKASRSQRQRWEQGRWAIARDQGLPLLKQGWAERSPLLLDLAMDVLVPPLSVAVGAAGVGTFAAAALGGFSGSVPVALGLFGLADLCFAFYVLRGWQLSGVGARGLLDLAWAPLYMLWKLTLLLRRSRRPKDEWVRTAREGETR